MALLSQCLIYTATLIGETGVLTEVRLHFLPCLQNKAEITCNSVMLVTSAAQSTTFHPVIQTSHVMNCVHLLLLNT
jgi:hypothetical protein